ncbi:hypothetical protein H6P81_007637 [Aristolochia fimbriata]|uniref:Uncharacterized protein n=1 Tax=Aristolochia fimbriata TaxID=158543 RepID=A0AAV7F116_ARIFI|nr:hypothetical protein H6P81_007637 [Aristolochia fimbriata]
MRAALEIGGKAEVPLLHRQLSDRNAIILDKIPARTKAFEGEPLRLSETLRGLKLCPSDPVRWTRRERRHFSSNTFHSIHPPFACVILEASINNATGEDEGGQPVLEFSPEKFTTSQPCGDGGKEEAGSGPARRGLWREGNQSCPVNCNIPRLDSFIVSEIHRTVRIAGDRYGGRLRWPLRTMITPTRFRLPLIEIVGESGKSGKEKGTEGVAPGLVYGPFLISLCSRTAGGESAAMYT